MKQRHVETVLLWPQGSMAVILTPFMEVPRGALSLGLQHTPSGSGTPGTHLLGEVCLSPLHCGDGLSRTPRVLEGAKMTLVCVAFGSA